MKINFDWEKIFVSLINNAERAKVFGGWIVRSYSSTNQCMVFVPDPNHEWEV